MKHKIGIVFAILFLFVLTGCSLFENQLDEPNIIEKEVVEIESTVTEVYEQAAKGCTGIYASNSKKGVASSGSGVIYKKENKTYFVVTNYHIVDDMDEYKVYLGGTKYYDAELIGYDSTNDLCVLTFSTDILGGEFYVHDIFNYPEEIVKVGQTVLAIGCPLGLSNFNSLSTGVVSRIGSTLIQTNAEVNPGNSGGGLFNLSGRLIGINSSKDVYTTGTDETTGQSTEVPVEGMGYAIPLKTIKNCITTIEKRHGAVERPTLGVTVSAYNRYLQTDAEKYLPSSLDQGVVVLEVTSGSPAAKAGVKVNDVILSLDSKSVVTLDDITEILHSKEKGETLIMKIWRSNENEPLSLTISL